MPPWTTSLLLATPSGSNSYDVKYKVTGESPATVKTVEQPGYHTSMPEGMAIVVPQTVTHEGVEYTVTAVDDRFFYGWKGVSLALPSTVTSIGASAFSKNMTKAEASAVVFALKADPSSESLLDLGLLNYMKVTMKEDTDGTITDG